MPRRDGTGPMGKGAMTGRGLGLCTGVKTRRNVAGLGYGFGLGAGYGCRRSLARGFGGYFAEELNVITDKELLEEQREILKRRLDVINRQLDTLPEEESK